MSRKSLSEFFGGLIVLALGIIFLLAANDIIPYSDLWIYFLISLGGIFLLDALLRTILLKGYFFSGRFITGIILLVIGLSFLFRFRNWWPFLLIIIGFLIILRGVLRRGGGNDQTSQ